MAKYVPLAAAVSSRFTAAVIERFGTCCDALVGLVTTLCGSGERDSLRCEDYTFSASSRSTYMAGLLTFSAVVADAAMVERVIEMDVREGAAERFDAPRRAVCDAAVCPGPREIEGIGGQFWYEVARP